MALPTNIRQQCEEILALGLARFDMMVGIVSKIENEEYEVVAVSSETGIPSMGDKYELEGVYCREVYSAGKTIAITEYNGEEGMCLHPLYTVIPCEAYISSPILVGGKTWGTLNFTSFTIREFPFSEADIDQNEEWAQHIANLVNEELAATG